MSKLIKNILASLILASTFSLATIVEVELRNNNITPRPLPLLEEHGEGVIVFDFVETLNYEDIPHKVGGVENTEIEITLTKIKVKNNDVSLITGDMLNYFRVTIETDGTLFFQQKTDIPKGTIASVRIPIEVTENSLITDNKRNGYIANLSCINDTTTPDIAQYTYTKGVDTDGDGIPDAVDIDDDNDGILDTVEGSGSIDTDGDNTPDSLDTDSDNDNVLDTIEGHDANHDGIADTLPTGKDTDGDGLDDAFDIDNGGITAPTQDTDSDGKPDFQDIDDDNDGKLTKDELPATDDLDGDGIPDYLDATDSRPDTDGDNIPDVTDIDDDNDGILDINEGNGLVDTDGDNTPDSLDTDSDNDNVLDAIEGHDANIDGVADVMPTGRDTDGDGLDDAFDQDSNGTQAARQDTDNDGKPDFQDTDDDNDGKLTKDELPATADLDGDGIPDYLDAIDSRPDTDGDNIPDTIDIDDDNDGILDTVEGSGIVDTDGDNTPDSLDIDADNDGVPDAIEGHDANKDGVADTIAIGLDTDNDGLDDAFDPDNGGTSAPIQDTDEDGKPNFQDIDDDDDGIDTNGLTDVPGEEGRGDKDKDGIPDYLDPLYTTPNYTMRSSPRGANIYTTEAQVDIVLTITENKGGLNNGFLRIQVPKDGTFTMSYNPNLTRLNGKNLSNSEWEVSEDNVSYILTYIGNGGIYEANKASFIGLEVDVKSPTNSNGVLNHQAVIMPGSGEDLSIDRSDNSDFSSIAYRNY